MYLSKVPFRCNRDAAFHDHIVYRMIPKELFESGMPIKKLLDITYYDPISFAWRIQNAIKVAESFIGTKVIVFGIDVLEVTQGLHQHLMPGLSIQFSQGESDALVQHRSVTEAISFLQSWAKQPQEHLWYEFNLLYGPLSEAITWK